MDKKLFRFIILIVALSILMVFALFNLDIILNVVATVSLVLRPVIVGFIIAFVLNNPYEKTRSLYNKIPKVNKFKKLTNNFALITVYLMFIALITVLVLVVIPQLVESVSVFKDNINGYLANFEANFNKLYAEISDKLPENSELLDKIYSILQQTPELIKKILVSAFDFTTSFVKTTIDVFLGIVISIYLLAGKDTLLNQFNRIIFALFKEPKAKKISGAFNTANTTFSNFIVGQLTEAFVLGSLCFVGMVIFKFEYKFLISTLIGVTSLLPVVGAFIGTIPSAFILLLIDPMKAVWFVIFIIVLQQLESNLIYPRVVGNKVGLPAIWVLFSILIGGGLFGIVGMLLAVPTMSLIYELTRKSVNSSLKTKGIISSKSFTVSL